MNESECVVCGSKEYSLEEKWRGFHLAKCKHCGVTFTLNPDYHPEAYGAAYKGSEGTPVPEEYSYIYVNPAERLKLELQAFFLPPPRLTPAEQAALAWIKCNAPEGATVIDCGCGSGRFLRALRRHGFQGIGVELSPELVEMLNCAGLTTILGKAPDFRWDGESPFAITFFEVLEHIPYPVDVLKILRSRFPTASILASVPSPNRPGLLFKGERGLADYPPNHFLRWTPEALEIAFQRASYREVRVILPAPVGSEMLPGLGQLLHKLRVKARKGTSSILTKEGQNPSAVNLITRFKATFTLLALWGYQRAADIVGFPKAWLARQKGASAASMLVIAKP
jgi:SAM-dependent methyltransferase